VHRCIKLPIIVIVNNVGAWLKITHYLTRTLLYSRLSKDRADQHLNGDPLARAIDMADTRQRMPKVKLPRRSTRRLTKRWGTTSQRDNAMWTVMLLSAAQTYQLLVTVVIIRRTIKV